MSTKKSQVVTDLLEKARPSREFPKPVEGATLLEQGIVAVLQRRVTETQARSALTSLKKAYDDWNEARVAQPQEVAGHMHGGKGAKSTRDPWIEVARDLRSYLQEVYQKTHGLDLDFIRDDVAAGAKLIAQMPVLGQFDGTFLLWIAGGEETPVHQGMVRVLDRMGLASRTGSIKKARSVIEPLAPKGQELAFAATLGHIAEMWCDPRKPQCQDCPAVDDCKFGKKVFADWKASQARLEAQRKKEEARQRVIEKKEAEKKAREDERQRKRAEQQTKKLERERQKKQAEDARLRKVAEEKAKKEAAALAKKKAAEQKAKEREAAKKKAQADKAKSSTAKSKKAATSKSKKPATGKAGAKKSGTSRPASAPAAKKAARPKAAGSKSASSKSGARPATKSGAKAPAAKKAAPKKKAATARPKTASKAASKPTTKKKAATRRPATSRKKATSRPRS